MTLESKLIVLRHRLAELSPKQRETALDFMVGSLSAHVSMDVWHNALDAAVDAASDHGRNLPHHHDDPPASGKDASQGPDR